MVYGWNYSTNEEADISRFIFNVRRPYIFLKDGNILYRWLAYAYTPIHTRERTYIYTHIYTHELIHTHTHTHSRTHTHTHTHIYIYIYILLNLKFYVEMYLGFRNLKKIIVIPTGEKKKENPEVGEMGRKLFTTLLPHPSLPSCVYSVCNYLIH